MAHTIDTVTNEQLRALSAAAVLAADARMVQICTRALEGDRESKGICVFVLNFAEAGQRELDGNEAWGLAEQYEDDCRAEAECERLDDLRDQAEQHAVDRYLDDRRGANADPEEAEYEARCAREYAAGLPDWDR